MTHVRHHRGYNIDALYMLWACGLGGGSCVAEGKEGETACGEKGFE
jgi:hypothetical protein